MHDHLFFAGDLFHSEERLAHDMPFSYPRLYLANGVTTIRTDGSFEPNTDLEITSLWHRPSGLGWFVWISQLVIAGPQ